MCLGSHCWVGVHHNGEVADDAVAKLRVDNRYVALLPS
jgi:hypothetical protein